MSEIQPVTEKIKDFVFYEKGKPPIQQPYFGADSEIYLTPDYLRGGAVSEPIKASANAVRVLDGDTIVLWDGSNAGEVFRARKGVLSSTMTRLKHDETYSSDYFLYALKVWEPFLKGQTSGSGIPHVDKEVLGNLSIVRFEMDEQKKISEILLTVDRAIEQSEALIVKQQKIKTGLMQDLLTRGIDAQGNIRSEQTHEFKNSRLGRIPVEWTACSLESVASFVTSGSRGWAQYYATEGAIFLRIGNLTRHHINMRFDDVIRVNPPKLSEGNRTSVLAGDLLISITADLGIVAVIPDIFEQAYVNQHISLVRLNKLEVNPRFVGWFLASRSGQTQFEKLNESGAKAGLNLSAVKNLLIPKMEIAEQARIAEIIDANTLKAAELEKRLNKMRLLKDGLMQDLLAGKKRVTPLLDPTH
jgi:type I restriction enzyme S subunit